MAQGGPISPCTYTATPCTPLHGGDGTQTVTIYEVPFTATAVEKYDCQGCTEVTVEPKDCFGPGPEVPVSSLCQYPLVRANAKIVCPH